MIKIYDKNIEKLPSFKIEASSLANFADIEALMEKLYNQKL